MKYFTGTSYEIILSNERDNSQTYLVAYSKRKSRQGLYSVMFENERIEAIKKITGCEWIERVGKASEGYRLGRGTGNAGWIVKFSGRTRIDVDVREKNEHPFILDQ